MYLGTLRHSLSPKWFSLELNFITFLRQPSSLFNFVISFEKRKTRRMRCSQLFCHVMLLLVSAAFLSAAANRTFEIRGNAFYKDGKRFRIVSGSMHYWRIVPEYWTDRLHKVFFYSLSSISCLFSRFFKSRRELVVLTRVCAKPF